MWHDLNWKQLAISSAIAFILFLLGSFLIQLIQEQSFAFFFNTGLLHAGTDSIERTAQNFFNSYYWAPSHIFLCLLTQTAASFYLAKNTPSHELTNGLALGVTCMVLVYRFNPILSALGIISSLITCYKVRQKP